MYKLYRPHRSPRITEGRREYPPTLGVRFRGSDAVTTQAGLSLLGTTGAADSKQFLFSCWFYLYSKPVAVNFGSQNVHLLFDINNARAQIFVQYQQNMVPTFPGLSWITIECAGSNAAGASVLGQRGCSAKLYHDKWNHLLTAVDLSTLYCRHYLNDELAPHAGSGGAAPTLVNDFMGSSIGAPPKHVVGGQLDLPTGQVTRDLGMAEFYLAWNQVLDVDVEANRRKFITKDRKAVFLGAAGALPTGTAPLNFHRLLPGEDPSVSFPLNRGSGANRTIQVTAGFPPFLELTHNHPPCSWTRPDGTS